MAIDPASTVTRRRRLVEVTRRVVFGTKAAVEQVLAAGGRRGMTLCKGEDGLWQQLAWSQGDDNVCLPHASVRQPLPQPEATNGHGSATQWRPRTPAMTAGLTAHVWTLREGLLFRVLPWPQLQAV